MTVPRDINDPVRGLVQSLRAFGDGTWGGRVRSATPSLPRQVGGAGTVSAPSGLPPIDRLTLTDGGQQVASGSHDLVWSTELVGLTPRVGFYGYGGLPTAAITIASSGVLVPRLHIARDTTGVWEVLWHVTRDGQELTDTPPGPVSGGREFYDHPGLTVLAGDVLRVRIVQTSGAPQSLLSARLDLVLWHTGEGMEASAPAVPPPAAAPTGLSATGGDQRVVLDWADNPEPSLAGYNVYRSTVSGGPYAKVNSTLVAGSSFTDTGLTNGTTYHYVVTAVDDLGRESGFSAQASARAGAQVVGVTQNGSGSTGAVGVYTLPVPAQAQAGDVLVAGVMLDNRSTGLDAPAGWTRIADDVGATPTWRMSIWTKVAQAGDLGTSPQFDVSGSERVRAGIMVAVRDTSGVGQVSPVDDVENSLSDSTTWGQTVDGVVLLFGFRQNGNVAGNPSGPAGFTLQAYEPELTVAGSYAAEAVLFTAYRSAGNHTDAVTFVGTAASGRHLIAVALRMGS